MQRGRKVVLLGPSGSGKTTFFKKCTDPNFTFSATTPTRFVDAKIVSRPIDGIVEQFLLVDTVGNALFGISDSAGGIFDDIRIVLCFFDMSMHKSWQNLILSDRFDNLKTFIECRHKQITDVDFILIGGKSDKERRVTKAEIEGFVESASVNDENEKINLFRLPQKFFKCSAATGEGVDEILDFIASIIANDSKRKRRDSVTVHLLEKEDTEKPRRSCC